MSSGYSGSWWVFLSNAGNMSVLGDGAQPIHLFTHNGSRQDPLSHPFSSARGNHFWRMRPFAILHGIYKSRNTQLEFLSLMDDLQLFWFSPFCNVSSLLSFSSCQRKVVSYFSHFKRRRTKTKCQLGRVPSLCGSKCIEEGDLCRRVWVFLC